MLTTLHFQGWVCPRMAENLPGHPRGQKQRAQNREQVMWRATEAGAASYPCRQLVAPAIDRAKM